MAKAARGVVAVVLAVTIASVLIAPIADVVGDNTGTQTVTNESVQTNFDEVQDLEGYDIDDSSETVYYDNGTAGSYETATEGTDYELYPQNGSIELLSSGNIESGDDVQVTYDYQATGSTTTLIAGFVVTFVVLLILGTVAGKLQEMM